MGLIQRWLFFKTYIDENKLKDWIDPVSIDVMIM